MISCHSLGLERVAGVFAAAVRSAYSARISTSQSWTQVSHGCYSQTSPSQTYLEFQTCRLHYYALRPAVPTRHVRLPALTAAVSVKIASASMIPLSHREIHRRYKALSSRNMHIIHYDYYNYYINNKTLIISYQSASSIILIIEYVQREVL